MRQGKFRTSDHPSRLRSVWLLAAAICLCPAAAQALDATETATGNGALASQGSGAYYSTADGYVALQHNTTGPFNTATGAEALYFNTTGAGNTACGGAALLSNTTGSQNSALGYSALYATTTGTYNTATGDHALYGNTSGNNNVAVGVNALFAVNGSNNIALGANAGGATKSGNSDIYIGHPGFNGTESRVTRIGHAQTQVFVAGIAGVPLSGATVVVNGAGQLGVVASSARYKQDIHSLDDASDKLAQLRPVSYRYKTEPDATHYGLIAEEVDKVMPELVVRDEESRPESVQYQELIPLLLQQWQAQRALIAQQQAESARQRVLIERQGKELAELRRTLATRFAAFGGTAKIDDVK